MGLHLESGVLVMDNWDCQRALCFWLWAGCVPVLLLEVNLLAVILEDEVSLAEFSFQRPRPQRLPFVVSRWPDRIDRVQESVEIDRRVVLEGVLSL